MKRNILIIASLIVFTSSVIAFYNYSEGKCSADKNCTACKNCKYCKNCSKDGGTCGICK